MHKQMTNQETANHIREYVKKSHGNFSWPTDACGYDQHVKFVVHRNKNWKGIGSDWNEFCLSYADELEKQEQP